jgi:outer membrane protein
MMILVSFSISAQDMRWTLKQCIDSAISFNLTVRLSTNTIELDRLNHKQSKNNLLPAINGNLGEALNVGRTVNPVTYQYQTGTAWTTSASLGFSQNLFSGLQYLNAIKQNELIYESSKYDLDDAKFNLTISIINAYLQVLYTSEAIRIAQNQVTADSTQLQTTSDLAYVGKKTESDMLQIRSQLTSDKYAVVNATSQWKLVKVNLQQLINLPVSESFDIDYSTAVDPPQKPLDDINAIYTQSLSFQPIIKSYTLRTRSLDYAIRAAKGAYFPQLLLKGNIGTNYSSLAKQTSTTYTNTLENIGFLQSDPSQIVSGYVPRSETKVNNYPFGNQLSDNLSGTLSLGLSIPILNYLQVRNNVRRQQVNLSNAKLNEELTRVNLRKTIEQVYVNAENSQAQYRSAGEEVEANKAAYDISIVKYKEGKMIATDLIVLKNSYIKAQSDLLQAKYGLLFNDKILDYYRGVPITF